MTLHLRPSTLMDQLMTIKARTVTVDSHEVPIETWASAGQVWMHMKALSVSERVEMAREEHPATHRFRCDPHASIDEGGRLAHSDGREWDIIGIDKTGVQWHVLGNLVTR